MDRVKHCPECGAEWAEGRTCAGDFHEMGGWELEYMLYDVHHLMVLSYHLQHPSLYSPDGLENAKGLLIQFFEEGVTPQEVRKKNSAALDSGTRKFKIAGTPESYGKYAHPVQWTMTAADVVAGGMDNFYANVEKWADSILKSLRESGNLRSK
jgi:hypothetical protein